jgi:hypothetical protein
LADFVFDVVLVEKGWITSTLLLLWLKKLAQNIKRRPLLLVVDCHSTRYCCLLDTDYQFPGRFDMEVMAFCAENQIHLLGLPPNMTWNMQVPDLAIFGPLKTFVAALRTMASKSTTVNKTNIAALITKALLLACSLSNIVAGFKAAGLYPWNPQVVIDRLKLKKSKVAAPTGEALIMDKAQKQLKALVRLFIEDLHMLYSFCQHTPASSSTTLSLQEVLLVSRQCL